MDKVEGLTQMQVDVGEFVKVRRIVYTLHVNWNGGWTVSEKKQQNNVSFIAGTFYQSRPSDQHHLYVTFLLIYHPPRVPVLVNNCD